MSKSSQLKSWEGTAIPPVVLLGTGGQLASSMCWWLVRRGGKVARHVRIVSCSGRRRPGGMISVESMRVSRSIKLSKSMRVSTIMNKRVKTRTRVRRSTEASATAKVSKSMRVSKSMTVSTSMMVSITGRNIFLEIPKFSFKTSEQVCTGSCTKKI